MELRRRRDRWIRLCVVLNGSEEDEKWFEEWVFGMERNHRLIDESIILMVNMEARRHTLQDCC